MKKIIFIYLLLAVILTACHKEIPNENTIIKKSVDKEKEEFKEAIKEDTKKVEIEKKSLDKKENKKTEKEKTPVAIPKEMPKEEKITVEKIEIKNKSDKSDDNGQKRIKEAEYKISKNYADGTNFVDLEYYASQDPDLTTSKYNITTTIIDETGENILIVPQIYGGNIRINKLEYDSEKNNYKIADEIINKNLQDGDVILLKSYIGEARPNLIITYEKKGEYIMQTMPKYNGIDGSITAEKGFRIVDKRR